MHEDVVRVIYIVMVCDIYDEINRNKWAPHKAFMNREHAEMAAARIKKAGADARIVSTNLHVGWCYTDTATE